MKSAPALRMISATSNEYVLQYLGRYTHRVAISNHRLVALADGQVTFRWRDSADHALVTLELWPTHLLLLGRPAFLQYQRIQWTRRGMQVPLREVEITSGFFQIVMA